jgi:hypothetical protein
MIEQKNALVLEGRKISVEMEKIEKEIEECEEMEKRLPLLFNLKNWERKLIR